MGAPLAALARVLDRDEDRVVEVVDDRAARLGVGGDGQELLDPAAVLALEGDLVESVGVADLARLAVGGDPQRALRVEGQVVRAGDRGDLVLREAREVGGLRGGGIAGQQQDRPVEAGRGVVVALLGDLDDVAVAVAAVGHGDGVGLVDVVGGAPRVVGQRHVDLAAGGAGLDVLGAVHLGRADGVGRETGVDQDLLDGEAGDQGAVVAHQRDPGARAVEGAVGGNVAGAVDLAGGGVALEACDVERALAEQLHVVRLVALAVHATGDELVDVVVRLVVAGVDDGVAGAGDVHGAGLVLEAAQRRVLDRGRGRVVGVDLDDPAEAVGLVLVALVVEVEAGVDEVPAARGGAGGDAHALLLLDARGAHEVLVEVLLAREDGAPRGGAAGAVVQGAEHGHALGVLDGLQQVRARGGAVHGEGGEAGDAPVAAAADDVGPGLARAAALEVDDRQAVGGDCGAHDVLGVRGDVLRGEHDVLVGVLVVVHEIAGGALLVVDDDVEVVGVVAELLLLRLAGLVLEVELGGVLEQRVAPADDRGPVVAAGHRHVVDDAGHRVDGLEGEGPVALGVGAVVGPRRRGAGDVRADDHRGGQTAARAERDAARDRGVGDVAEVGIVGGVGDRVRAGAAALELAGDGEAVATGVAEHGEMTLEHGGSSGRERVSASGWSSRPLHHGRRGGARHGVPVKPR